MSEHRGLRTEARFAEPDAVFRLLTDAYRGLSGDEVAALNARLILLLTNHVGDVDVLREALQLARSTMPPRGT
jgi:hypothetical protein